MPVRKPVGEFHGHHQHDQGGEQEEALEEKRQAVEGIHLAEGVLRGIAGREPDGKQAVEQDRAQANRGGVAEIAFGGGRQPQVREEQSQPEGDDQPFVNQQAEVHWAGSSTSLPSA